MNTTTAKIMERLMTSVPELSSCREAIQQSYALLLDCFSLGHKVLVCGNGGSAADSEHVVGEMMKSFLLPRHLTEHQRDVIKSALPEDYDLFTRALQRCLPAISLVSQTALISAYENDVSPEMAYAQQVFGYGTKGDLLIAISTSGSSRSVVNAAKAAYAFGLHSVALTGEALSPLSDLCTATVRVPARDTAGAQEYHIKVYHALCAMIENELFGND